MMDVTALRESRTLELRDCGPTTLAREMLADIVDARLSDSRELSTDLDPTTLMAVLRAQP